MRSSRALQALYSAALLAVVAFASSCAVWRSIVGESGPPPRPFNHLAHLDRGVDCLSCHEGADKLDLAGMPGKDLCMTCHEDIDKDPERPAEKKVAWFLDAKGEPAWSAFTKQSKEVLFSHGRHAGKGVACASCHEGIEKNTGLVPGMVQRMSSCVACHESSATSYNRCESCHSEITATTRPPNHDRIWKRMHGQASRMGAAAATANQCSMCHEKDSCASCHQAEAPENHNAFWRIRGHGIAATVDRMRCQTCHASDGCDRCHQETAPASHTAGWDCPRNRHCNGCHVPLQTSGSCFVCHKSTPGHDTAPPMPAWHNPSLNCRSCHAASLKHPDNGDRCISCHR
ncbi:MAG TPA: cytochrome c3 family protein [Planctomycetota bacterium]|nr:cytochrome c3 family protein [Planctomycetota bacterium]